MMARWDLDLVPLNFAETIVDSWGRVVYAYLLKYLAT